MEENKRMKDEKFGLHAIINALKKVIIFLIVLWASRCIVSFNGVAGWIFVAIALLITLYVLEKNKLKRDAEQKRWEELDI